MRERTTKTDSQTTSTLFVVLLVSAGLSILGAGPLLWLAAAANDTAGAETPQALILGAEGGQDALAALQVALAPDDDTTFSLHGATVSGTLYIVISAASGAEAVATAQLDGVPLDLSASNLVAGPIGGLLRIDANTLASGRHELAVDFEDTTSPANGTDPPVIVTFFVAES